MNAQANAEARKMMRHHLDAASAYAEQGKCLRAQDLIDKTIRAIEQMEANPSVSEAPKLKFDSEAG